ncbi:hypothetical protein AcW1_003539 [Taiwanofungus camphoratus]|nr:hypothetical protein AcW1_003539 [Antrodia cinnamomea]
MASSQCGTFIYSGAQMRGRSDTFYTYIASECEQFLRVLTFWLCYNIKWHSPAKWYSQVGADFMSGIIPVSLSARGNTTSCEALVCSFTASLLEPSSPLDLLLPCTRDS